MLDRKHSAPLREAKATDEASQLPVRLNLAAKTLNDNDIPAILSFIHEHKEITQLDLSKNQITFRGATKLADLAQIDTIILDNNKIGDHGLRALSGNLNLKILSVENNGISYEGARSLMSHPQLEALNISSNKIDDRGAILLSRCHHLQALDARHCGITASGTISLANFNKTIIFLKLSGNPISDEGALALSKNSQLESLFVSDCGLGYAAARAFSQSTKLHTLDISDNQIGLVGAKQLVSQSRFNALNIIDKNTELDTTLLENLKQLLHTTGIDRGIELIKNGILGFDNEISNTPHQEVFTVACLHAVNMQRTLLARTTGALPHIATHRASFYAQDPTEQQVISIFTALTNAEIVEIPSTQKTYIAFNKNYSPELLKILADQLRELLVKIHPTFELQNDVVNKQFIIKGLMKDDVDLLIQEHKPTCTIL